MLEDILKKYGGQEVTALDVYKDIFKLGYGYIQRSNEESETLKGNPLAYWKNNGASTGHYRILFEDTFEETLQECQAADFCIVNGLTYFGRKNTQEHADRLFCLIFDIDGVEDRTLELLLARFDFYPRPNYIALSGHGVHLYYVMEEPVPLYPNIKLQLKAFKYALIDKLWTDSTLDNVQYQGINQGFRVLGGKTKIDGVKVKVYNLNKHPYNLTQLGEYIPAEARVDESKLYKESALTLEEAKVKYPEWYKRRIEEGDTTKGHWTCKRDLYDWWIRQIKQGASYHHRYFCIMCLAIYGVKSGIDIEEVEKDAFELQPFMNRLTDADEFTEADIRSALECFDYRYCTFPRDDISKLTNITIKENKRNYQKQSDHLEEARAIRDIRQRRKGKTWQNKEGRPAGSGTKEAQVKEWRRQNPNKRKADCIRETGLSKPTVYKYWEVSKETSV